MDKQAFKEYIESRYNDQIDWYDKKASSINAGSKDSELQRYFVQPLFLSSRDIFIFIRHN